MRLRLFDQRLGLTDVLIAVSGKRNRGLLPPDLFDELECRLSSSKKSYSLPFIAEFVSIRSRRELASSRRERIETNSAMNGRE